MNVLIVAGEFPPMQGGLGDFTRVLTSALVDEGASVTVYAPKAATPIDPAWRFRVRAEADDWSMGDVRRLRDLVRGFDVVNLQYQAAAYGMRPPIHVTPWLTRPVPTVTTFHDLRVPYLFPKAGPLRRMAVDGLLRMSAASIITNEEDLEEARQRQPKANINLVRIGSNVHPTRVLPQDRQAFRRRFGLPDTATWVSYFAFLNASKGGLELVRAIAQARQAGHDLHLLFIGGEVGASDATNVAYAARVHAEIEALRLESVTHRTGYLDEAEVSLAFAATDICALPFLDGASYRRGSLMAALAHGMPVVTTEPVLPVAGLSEGENVVLVPRGDAEALSAALVSLAGDGERRRSLSQAARRLAQGFEWPAIARATLKVFEGVVR